MHGRRQQRRSHGGRLHLLLNGPLGDGSHGSGKAPETDKALDYRPLSERRFYGVDRGKNELLCHVRHVARNDPEPVASSAQPHEAEPCVSLWVDACAMRAGCRVDGVAERARPKFTRTQAWFSWTSLLSSSGA